MAGGPTFDQRDWDVRGDVYNVAGDLLLTKESSKEDLAAAVAAVRAELSGLANLPDEDRREIDQELAAAADEAIKPEAEPDRIKSRLERVRDRLESLDGIAAGALNVAKTAGRIAAWVGAFL